MNSVKPAPALLTTSVTGTSSPSVLTTCYVPQELQEAVNHILPLIHQYRTEHLSSSAASDRQLELEVRLGRRNKQTQRWESEVSKSFFSTTLEMLKSFDGWTETPVCTDSHDFFYMTPAGKRIRTTLEFGSPCRLTHINKTPVGVRDVKLVEHSCDARISLKQETVVHEEELPDVVSTVLVRIKKRTSFCLDKWRIDLTQVWSGATRNEAEQHQANGNNAAAGQCAYEIEIEFCGSREYVASVTDQYIATSLLLKLCSVLGSGVIYMLPLTAPRLS